MRHLTLHEHEPAETELRADELAALQAAVPSLGVSPTGDGGTVRLHPGHHVGTVVLPGLTVHLRPKLGTAPVLFLLAYALDPRNWREHYTAFAASDRLLESFVPGFLAHLHRALRRGPLQGYRSIEDAESTVRGRLRFDEQLRRRQGRFPPAEIRYDAYTVDTDLNRLLKAAIVRLGRLPLRRRELATKLRNAEQTLDGVQLVRYHPARLPEITFNRLNDHYRPAITLARMVLRGIGTEHRPADAPSSSFLVDMNALFETFVATALREQLGLTTREFPQNSQGRPLWLDTARAVRLEPDLSWWHRGVCAFVGDAKYKTIKADGVRHPDLYQLLAYCIATDLDRGLLVYAAGEASNADHEISEVAKRLHVRTLDVSREPDDILADVATLADEIVQLRQAANAD